jgi:hypothetical protein
MRVYHVYSNWTVMTTSRSERGRLVILRSQLLKTDVEHLQRKAASVSQSTGTALLLGPALYLFGQAFRRICPSAKSELLQGGLHILKRLRLNP